MVIPPFVHLFMVQGHGSRGKKPQFLWTKNMATFYVAMTLDPLISIHDGLMRIAFFMGLQYVHLFHHISGLPSWDDQSLFKLLDLAQVGLDWSTTHLRSKAQWAACHSFAFTGPEEDSTQNKWLTIWLIIGGDWQRGNQSMSDNVWYAYFVRYVWNQSSRVHRSNDDMVLFDPSFVAIFLGSTQGLMAISSWWPRKLRNQLCTLGEHLLACAALRSIESCQQFGICHPSWLMILGGYTTQHKKTEMQMGAFLIPADPSDSLVLRQVSLFMVSSDNHQLLFSIRTIGGHVRPAGTSVCALENCGIWQDMARQIFGDWLGWSKLCTSLNSLPMVNS